MRTSKKIYSHIIFTNIIKKKSQFQDIIECFLINCYYITAYGNKVAYRECLFLLSELRKPVIKYDGYKHKMYHVGQNKVLFDKIPKCWLFFFCHFKENGQFCKHCHISKSLKNICLEIILLTNLMHNG